MYGVFRCNNCRFILFIIMFNQYTLAQQSDQSLACDIHKCLKKEILDDWANTSNLSILYRFNYRLDYYFCIIDVLVFFPASEYASINSSPWFFTPPPPLARGVRVKPVLKPNTFFASFKKLSRTTTTPFKAIIRPTLATLNIFIYMIFLKELASWPFQRSVS